MHVGAIVNESESTYKCHKIPDLEFETPLQINAYLAPSDQNGKNGIGRYFMWKQVEVT